MSPSVLGVVPVRLASSRLPRKPLHPLLGRPLLEWVWRRVSGMALFDRVVVATDAPEIRELCTSMGAPVEMTDPGHESGTDRVAEVVERPGFRDFPVIVNVQGDEPLILEEHLEAAVRLVRDVGWEVGTCGTPLGSPQALEDPSIVKLVGSATGRALYFSRAPIPHRRDGAPTSAELAASPFLRHVGIYVYQRDALLRWVGLPISPLEKLERLEQLRALEAGIRIGFAVVHGAQSGVDTPDDVTRIERILAELSDHPMATTDL